MEIDGKIDILDFVYQLDNYGPYIDEIPPQYADVAPLRYIVDELDLALVWNAYAAQL